MHRKRPVLAIATHALAAAAGCGLVIIATGDGGRTDAAAGDSAPDFRPGGRTARDHATSASVFLDALLRQPPGKTRLGRHARLPDLEPAADPAAATQAAADGDDQAVLIVRLLQWMDRDHAAALEWFAANLVLDDGYHVLSHIMPRLSDAEFAAAVEEGGWIGITMVPTAMGAWLSHQREDGDARAVARVADALSPPLLAWFGEQLGSIWPVERIGEVEDLLLASGAQTAIPKAAMRMPPAQRFEWYEKMADRLEDPSILRDRPERALLLQADTTRSLDERLAMLKTMPDTGPSRLHADWETRKRDEMIRGDIRNSLGTDDAGSPFYDWRHQLRIGRLDPGELLAAMRQAHPEIARDEPDALAMELHRNLLNVAPEAALELVAHLPPPVLQRHLAQAGTINHPDAMFTTLHAVEPDGSIPLNERFAAWSAMARNGVSRHGDAYLDWTLALPPSIERDFVLSSVHQEMRNFDAEWATEFNNARTYKDGWRPGMK